MIESCQKVTIPFEKLDSYSLSVAEPYILTVEWEGVKFDFLIRMRPNASHLLVMGSGAMNYFKKRINPPYFQRHSWMDEFQDSMIYYSDPTLYLNNDLGVGWGQGTMDRHYLREMAAILEKLISKTQIPLKQVLFYGSSAGGFMSLMLAGFIKGTKALVNGPQTDLTKWLEVPVKKVFELSYPNLSMDEIQARFPDRINVAAFYQKIKYVPKIYYLQNVYCEIDIKGHLFPFIEELQKIDPASLVNRVVVDLYYHYQPGPEVRPELGGHGAVSKQETIDYINKVKVL